MKGQEQTVKGSRQVFDLPSIAIEVTEHRQYEACCEVCGVNNVSNYPEALNKGQTQYGPKIKSLVAYMSVRQYMPMKRLVEFISIIVGQKMSQGTVQNILRWSSHKAQEAYEHIREQISKSPVVGSDESGCNVQGKIQWMWAFQNELYTYLKIAPSRGYQVIESTFPEGLENSIIVSDCWAAQLKTPSKGKQLCLPHLVRNLNELKDCYQSKWAHRAKEIFLQIMILCQQNRINKADKIQIEQEIDTLLNRPLKKSKKKVKTFLKRLLKNRKHLTTCLYLRKVPPDNNASERAIRNMKVKTKVSGLFRSQEGANIYATLRSIVDTAIKQNISPFKALSDPDMLIK